MVLEHLELVDFRNYASLDLEPAPGLNLLVGENAQGKTSLLEALYLLGTSRSFRASQEAEMLRWGGEGARVLARFRRDGGAARELEFRWQRGPEGGLERQVLRNRLPLKRLADFLGEVPMALFVPGDLALVQGGPQGRRRYLDLLLCKLSPVYLSALARLQQVLRQRNELLRRRPAPGPAELGPWDQQLAAAAATLVPRREAVVQDLHQAARAAFLRLSDGRADLGLAYRPAGPGTEAGFLAALAERRRDEVARGTTLVGPHRDDLELRLDGRSLRRYGSQGQQRSAALALRLGEAQVLSDRSGERALVLLDDCFSELDPGRRDRLLDVLGGCRQVFVTTTSLPEPLPRDAEVLHVEGGAVRRG